MNQSTWTGIAILALSLGAFASLYMNQQQDKRITQIEQRLGMEKTKP